MKWDEWTWKVITETNQDIFELKLNELCADGWSVYQIGIKENYFTITGTWYTLTQSGQSYPMTTASSSWYAILQKRVV